MDIIDFLLSITSSIIGNKLTPVLAAKQSDDASVEPEITPPLDHQQESPRLAVRAVIDPTSSARFGEILRNLLLTMKAPNVFLFIESERTTFYNLVTVVVEDSRTGDWYPFEQLVAFEGSGGGWKTTEQLLYDLKTARSDGADVSISVRVAYSSDLKGLIAGTTTWLSLKERSIPAFIAADTHYRSLQDRFAKAVLDNQQSADD